MFDSLRRHSLDVSEFLRRYLKQQQQQQQQQQLEVVHNASDASVDVGLSAGRTTGRTTGRPSSPIEEARVLLAREQQQRRPPVAIIFAAPRSSRGRDGRRGHGRGGEGPSPRRMRPNCNNKEGALSSPTAAASLHKARERGSERLASSMALRVPAPSGWAAEDPAAGVARAVATAMLVLRDGASLDSMVVGKVPAGSEAYVLETRELPHDVTRCLLAIHAHASPLGWVTARRGKDGAQLLVLRQAAGPPRPQFYSSLHNDRFVRFRDGVARGRARAAVLTSFVGGKATTRRGASARATSEVRL